MVVSKEGKLEHALLKCIQNTHINYSRNRQCEKELEREQLSQHEIDVT